MAKKTMKPSEKIKCLINRGVKIPNPDHIDIGDEVDVEKISGKGVIIYSGCKLFGSSTFIQYGVKLGYEAPVTLENCQLGKGVELNGGFFRNAVFLNNVKVGSGAHVREGTIIEEEASIAHAVGLKQTILFPFVTLGSLINFCDCLMSGGTDKKNHSEVGSSYIHFNYTPDQHKAAASLIGDVARGVMLTQKPIFLGGQGGLVGPCRLEFGTIVAAGTICRKDELRPDRLIFGESRKEGNIAYKSGIFQGETRIIKNNIEYIANLNALMKWYENIRSQFISNDFAKELFEGLLEKLGLAIEERVNKLKEYYYRKNGNKIEGQWDAFKNRLIELGKLKGDIQRLDNFLEKISINKKEFGNDYIQVIKSLDEKDANLGTLWLKGIVDDVLNDSINILFNKVHLNNSQLV
ncbi:MAG: protein GlmU [Desulfobacterales bacterium]|nr:protein GlmU [Desulfobacterales bacterium]